MSEKWTCPLCHKSLKSPVVTKCGHVFCWPCISESLSRSDPPSCPTCQHPLKKEDIIPIYGQTDKVDGHEAPPPPPQQREEAPANDGNQGNMGWQVNGAFYGPFGLVVQINDQNIGVVLLRLFLPIVVMILMSILLGG